jgi:hypothetical protein
MCTLGASHLPVAFAEARPANLRVSTQGSAPRFGLGRQAADPSRRSAFVQIETALGSRVDMLLGTMPAASIACDRVEGVTR